MNPSVELAKERIRSAAQTLRWVTVQDCLFLAGAVLLSFCLYVFQLGFYSDDWIFLSLLELAEDHSVPGLLRALYAGDIVIRQRPVQMVYLSLLYRLFGLNPIGYHVVNAVLLTLGTILFYLAIRKMKGSRLLALALPLLYSQLPHYSTDRFWIAAHQATISMVFYFLSLYSEIQAVRSHSDRSRWWVLLSLTALLISGLAYEVALPLFLLHPLLGWLVIRQSKGYETHSRATWLRLAAAYGRILPALLVILVFKALITIRVNVGTDLVSHIAFLATGAVRVNFLTYGLGLPYVLWWILRNSSDWHLWIIGGGLGLAIYIYLARLDQSAFDLSSKIKSIALIGGGLLVFILGYSVFIASKDVWFTSASLGNRVAIAAAVGIAMIFTGLFSWLSEQLPAQVGRHKIFCSLASLACVTGFMINNTLAQFWTSAYQQQQSILKDIRTTLPEIKPESTLVLDGLCLEQGGAYIFTGTRDLTGLLRIAYGDRSLQATVLPSSPDIQADGLSVLTYRHRNVYPYGNQLYIYNYTQKRLYQLTDAVRARLYFEHSGFDPEQHCSPGFAWGLNTE